MTADEARARTNCFTRLAIATREKVEPATTAVYLESTAGWSLETLRVACHQLEMRSAWFPKVAEINEACHAAVKQREALRPQKSFPSHEDAPVSEARRVELLRSLADLVKRKDWPTGPSRV
jgi:hypothetical protein